MFCRIFNFPFCFFICDLGVRIIKSRKLFHFEECELIGCAIKIILLLDFRAAATSKLFTSL